MNVIPDIDLPLGFSPPGEARSPFTIRQAVAWGDMDAMQHVNNATYLRWFENVRFLYFELVGLNALHRAERIGAILARTEVDFLAPVTFPDDLLVTARVVRIGNTSLVMQHRVWSSSTSRICAKAEAIVVVVDYAHEARPTTIWEPIRAAIRALDGDVEA